MISERHILNTVHLSDVQKVVLAKIAGSATEQVAYEEISSGTNLVAARDMLQRLGLIDVTNDQATITPKGQEVMKDEALVDDMGTLTDEGNQFAQIHTLDDLKKIGVEDETNPGTEPPQNNPNETPDLSFEALKLFADINQMVNDRTLIQKINNS